MKQNNDESVTNANEKKRSFIPLDVDVYTVLSVERLKVMLKEAKKRDGMTSFHFSADAVFVGGKFENSIQLNHENFNNSFDKSKFAEVVLKLKGGQR